MSKFAKYEVSEESSDESGNEEEKVSGPISNRDYAQFEILENFETRSIISK